MKKTLKKTFVSLAALLLLATPVLAADTQSAANQPVIGQPAANQPANNAGGLTMNYKGITVNFGGFLEAAGIYRNKNMNSDVATPFQKLPLSNSAGYYQQETDFSARQSRLSLLVQGDYSPRTHLAGYYEMDFLGAATTANSNESNSYNPRIRNLYTTIDWDALGGSALGLHLLAGQNWSLVTLNDKGITPRNEVSPSVIDAQYVPGFTWARQPQFRIVADYNKKLWLALSIENAQTANAATGPNPSAKTNLAIGQTAGSNFQGTISANAWPDFIVKLVYEPGWGHFEIFDLVRTFESSIAGNGTVTSTNPTENSVGVGVILPLFTEKLKFQFSGLYGQGIGRYGSGQLPDVTMDQIGNLVPLTELQLLGGLRFDPTSEWSFYAYYGREQVAGNYQDVGGKGYGLGSNLYNTTIGAPISSSQAQVEAVSQVTVGAWWKFYQGSFGKWQAGLQYSYTDNTYFSGIGGSPYATNSIVMTSLRYYW